MQRLLAGYSRFREEVFPSQRAMFADLDRAQQPHTLFITCADSRVVPNLICQSDPGEIFTVRNVGNIVPPHGEFAGGVSSAIEYAVMALHIEHIVVLGHSDCGAMKALLHPERVADMKGVRSWLTHAQTALQVVEENCPDCSPDEKLARLTEENVCLQIDHLRTHPAVAGRVRKGSLQLHGWMYDIGDGTLHAMRPGDKTFHPLPECVEAPAFA